MQAIKVAFIGAGNMAQEHMKAFSKYDFVDLVGVYSRTKEKAESLAERFSIDEVCLSVDELYKTSQPNLVVITVPELSLVEVLEQVIKFDWNIFMEKPAGYDFKNAQIVMDLVSSHAQQVFVGLNRRFYSSIRAVSEDLSTRTDRRYVRVQDQQSYAEARLYNQPEEVVKNYMYANSIHNIDLIRLFCRGEVEKVERLTEWVGEETDIMLAKVLFNSGDIALYEGIWRGPGPWACSVSTESKRWVLQPVEQASYQLLGERKVHCIEKDALDVDFKPGVFKQAGHVLGVLRGNEDNNIISIHESFKSMKLVRDIFGV